MAEQPSDTGPAVKAPHGIFGETWELELHPLRKRFRDEPLPPYVFRFWI